jgi:nicotinamidase-related amidase
LSRLIKATQTRADEFAQSLRPQAPTVWVYHDPVLKLTDLPEDYLPCSDPRIRARKLERIREAGLEICGRVDAQADMVVRKPYRDAFEETDLHQRLQERAIDTLLITGLFRHYSYNKQRSECVGQTVASALARGYNTFIVEDLSVNKMVETPENRLSAVRMTTGENAYGVAARDVLRLINP